MANASAQATERGWVIYRESSTRPTLDEINARLAAEGLIPPEISPRTYKHYREMELHGIQEWMRINEFDQWRKRSA